MTIPTKQAAHDARRKAAGWRRVPVWCDPPTLAALAALTGLCGSEQEAVRRAIRSADAAPLPALVESLGHHGPKARDG